MSKGKFGGGIGEAFGRESLCSSERYKARCWRCRGVVLSWPFEIKDPSRSDAFERIHGTHFRGAKGDFGTRIPSRSEGRLWDGPSWQATARSDYAARGKKSFESALIGAQKIGLVQIVLSEGFTKNGEDFEVVGLRAGLPNRSSRTEFTLIWPLKHKSMRTGAMLCAPLGLLVRKGAGEVLKIAGNMECGRSGRSSRMRKALRMKSRYMRWAATYAVETDPEEFLLNANLFLASDMDRVRFAYLELTQSQIDNAENEEIKEACETGSRLFSDSHGVPLALYGTRRVSNKKPAGPSWGSETAPALEPGKLVEKLTSSAMGCYFILNVLEELLERCASVSGPPAIGCG